MKATKITGNTRALRVVVTAGRTKTRSRFLTVSVQICLRKRFNMVACSSISLRSSSSIPGEVRVSFKIEIDEPRSHCDYYRNILRLAQDGNQTDDVQATSAQDGGDWCFLDFLARQSMCPALPLRSIHSTAVIGLGGQCTITDRANQDRLGWRPEAVGEILQYNIQPPYKRSHEFKDSSQDALLATIWCRHTR